MSKSLVEHWDLERTHHSKQLRKECVNASQSPTHVMIHEPTFQTDKLSGQGRQPADAEALNRARNYIHYDRKGEQLVVPEGSLVSLVL